MENDTFKIIHTKGNKDNSLPEHHDIFIKGSDDSLFTVWAGIQLAKFIVLCLTHRKAIEAFLNERLGGAHE